MKQEEKLPGAKTSKDQLKEIHEMVHKRKVASIRDKKEPYIVDISQFAERQNNIVLNALSFINEVSEGSSKGTRAEEEKKRYPKDGVDFGYQCRLPSENLKLPEVQSLLNTKIDGYMDMSIRNIIA